MDWESRKYFWLGALVVAALLLMYAALEANRMAVNAVKQRRGIGNAPVHSVTETNKASARRRAYEQ